MKQALMQSRLLERAHPAMQLTMISRMRAIRWQRRQRV